MTGVKLELMKQRETRDIMEKGIRGGMCCISHKYAKANNPYIQVDYDPSEPTSYILYLDMNNLYMKLLCQSHYHDATLNNFPKTKHHR